MEHKMKILFKLISMALIISVCASLIILASFITEKRYASALKIMKGCRPGSHLDVKVSTGIFSDGMTVECGSIVMPEIDDYHFIFPFKLPQEEKEEPNA